MVFFRLSRSRWLRIFIGIVGCPNEIPQLNVVVRNHHSRLLINNYNYSFTKLIVNELNENTPRVLLEFDENFIPM